MSNQLEGDKVFLLARTLAPELGKKERAIAQFIDDNAETISSMGISDIARYLNVSVASITKVSKKLGFSGFHELKLRISQREKEPDEFIDVPVTPGDTRYCEKILESTFYNSILALQDSLSAIDGQVIKHVADLFVRRQPSAKIILAGFGGSAAISEDFSHKLLKIGIFSYVFNDSYKMLMAASLLNPGDIVLAVSHSGQTTDLLNVVKLANEKGADTVCLTNYANSPISLIARYPIISAVKNNPITGENATARVVHLNILDAIFTIVASKTSQQSQRNLMSTRNAVSDKRVIY